MGGRVTNSKNKETQAHGPGQSQLATRRGILLSPENPRARSLSLAAEFLLPRSGHLPTRDGRGTRVTTSFSSSPGYMAIPPVNIPIPATTGSCTYRSSDPQPHGCILFEVTPGTPACFCGFKGKPRGNRPLKKRHPHLHRVDCEQQARGRRTCIASLRNSTNSEFKSSPPLRVQAQSHLRCSYNAHRLPAEF